MYTKNTILILHIKGGDFMRSLSMEVTHVASYLEKFKREILEMIEKSSKVFQEITDTDTSDKNYVDSVRKKIKDYDKEFQKDFKYPILIAKVDNQIEELSKTLEKRCNIDFLKSVFSKQRSSNVTGNSNNRNRIHVSSCNSSHKVCSSRTACCHANSNTTCRT